MKQCRLEALRPWRSYVMLRSIPTVNVHLGVRCILQQKGVKLDQRGLWARERRNLVTFVSHSATEFEADTRNPARN